MAESTLTEQKSAPSGPIIVFIGRSNTAPDEQVKRELLETLHRVEQIHMEEYGSLDSRSVDFIPIIQGSNQLLRPSGEVMTKLSAVFQEARANAGCGVILVILGWDGFTTHDMSLLNLHLKAEGVCVTLRFCVEESDSNPRHFHDVKLRDALELLTDDTEPTDEDASLKAFFENYKRIQADGVDLSSFNKELHDRSRRRNHFPRPKDFEWTCPAPGCGNVFKTLVELTSHRERTHQQWSPESKREWDKCSFCQAEFTEPSSRDRHVKIDCPQNPDSEKNKSATKPRKK
ncbi:Zinc finger, C2H2-type [Penicillium camemberti]|uniref:Zinc finger, C2H2-type n=1 Tax=Penicillium camemberti (strain FM 013) TaxID=1429867 RepID=A0A0G4PEX0_PENC3|nr:Zinc finger, C2H2-type [Penicillium camemberti]